MGGAPQEAQAAFTIEVPKTIYDRQPFLRRGDRASLLLVAALLLFLTGGFWGDLAILAFAVSGIIVLTISITLLTGPVYYPPKPEDKTPRVWGIANQIVAVILIGLTVLRMVALYA